MKKALILLQGVNLSVYNQAYFFLIRSIPLTSSLDYINISTLTIVGSAFMHTHHRHMSHSYTIYDRRVCLEHGFGKCSGQAREFPCLFVINSQL